MNIGERLRSLREQNELSKNQLAKLAGVSQSYISDLEANKKNPTIDVLEKIADALGMTLVQFLRDPDSKDSLSPDLQRLLNAAKELTPEQRKALQIFIESMKGD